MFKGTKRYRLQDSTVNVFIACALWASAPRNFSSLTRENRLGDVGYTLKMVVATMISSFAMVAPVEFNFWERYRQAFLSLHWNDASLYLTPNSFCWFVCVARSLNPPCCSFRSNRAQESGLFKSSSFSALVLPARMLHDLQYLMIMFWVVVSKRPYILENFHLCPNSRVEYPHQALKTFPFNRAKVEIWER